MIGQSYFDLRSRLGSALFALKTAAADSGADPESAAIVDHLVASLKDPFVFVIAGEVNVGKSTFLNALFGSEFSKTGVMPTTDKICFFKHGESLRRVEVSRTLEEVYVPEDFLRDFNIVDTPGTNSIESEHQEITERFVPVADLVIFVFSAMNPWGASAWQFLEKVHTFWMRNVLFVLQQSDLREPEEVESILSYMRQLSRQRFNREFPTFAVSAKKAYLARSSGLDRERLMAESGFQQLENHISRTIAGSAQRANKLSGALRIAREILDKVKSRVVSRVSHREGKSQIVRDIAAGLIAQSERTLGKLSHAVEATASDMEHASQSLRETVDSQLGAGVAMRSIFQEKRSTDGLEKEFLAKVRAAGQERWQRAAAIIEDDIGVSAEHVNAQLSENLKMQLRDELKPDASFWQAQRRKFLARIDSIQQRVVADLEIEKHVAAAHTASRKRATSALAVFAVFAVVAGALGSMGWWPAAGGVVAAGLLIFCGMHFINARRLAVARREITQRLASGPEQLKQLLNERVRDELNDLFEAFGRILLPIREKLSEQEKRHEGVTRNLENLTQTFDELAAALGSASGATNA